MSKELSVFLSLLLASSLCWSRGDKGNGGDVVVCPGVSSPQMLDLIEREGTTGFDYNLNHYGESIEDLVEEAFSRIEKFTPILSERYRQYTSQLLKDIISFKEDYAKDPNIIEKRFNVYSDTVFTTNRLSDVPDSDHDSLPEGCTIHQLIIHRKPESKIDKRFKVNSDLLLRMDEKNIAAAIVHESLFIDIVKHDLSSNSRDARRLNYMVSTNYWDTLGVFDFIEVYKEANYEHIPFGAMKESEIPVNVVNNIKREKGKVRVKFEKKQIKGLLKATFDGGGWGKFSEPFDGNYPFVSFDTFVGTLTIGKLELLVTPRPRRERQLLYSVKPFELSVNDSGELLFTNESARSFAGEVEGFWGGPRYSWLFGVKTYDAKTTGTIGNCKLVESKRGHRKLFLNGKTIVEVKKSKDSHKIIDAIINGACGTGMGEL